MSFTYDKLHIISRLRREWQKGPFAETSSLVLGLMYGLGGHAAQTADQPAAGREVKPPVEATGAAPDAVVLTTTHKNEQGKFETLAVGSGLVVVAGFRRPP